MAAVVFGHAAIPGAVDVDGGYPAETIRALPGKGEEVEDGEEGHFYAEEHGGDADFDVLVVYGWGRGEVG